MLLPRILFVTCMPLETPRSASMAFMSVLLEKYPDAFAWFSLRSPNSGSENPFDIPYAYTQPLERPARFTWLKQFLNLIPWAWHLGYKAADFGRSQNVQVVLADLAFEAVVAGRVAAQVLGVPLLVSVHDDPVNRIKVKNYPAWLVKLFENEVKKTMSAAIRCGVISDYMGDVYRERYKGKTVTLFVGVEDNRCLAPKALDIDKSPILIGSLGSVNSVDNWNLLIKAIQFLNQSHGFGKFSVLHIGTLPENLLTTNDVEVTGWIREEEFLRHLSRIDVGFLNWSFDPHYAETRRTSFPLKTHSYIQAQVPMIALGPSDSSAVRFIGEYECGITCTEKNAKILADRLEKLFYGESVYEEALKGVQKLKQIFSRKQFFENFNDFINIL